MTQLLTNGQLKTERLVIAKQVQVSTDYSRFKLRSDQRPINAARVAGIKKLILKYGFIQNRGTVQVNSQGELEDGQHRFVVLRELGLPVFYVVDEMPTGAIDGIEKHKQNWSMEDHLHSQSVRGGAVAQWVIEKSKETKLKETAVLFSLGMQNLGGISLSSTLTDVQKSFASTVLDAFATIKDHLSLHGGYKTFSALRCLIRKPNFSAINLKCNLEKYPSKITPAVTAKDYFDVLLFMHNYHLGIERRIQDITYIDEKLALRQAAAIAKKSAKAVG